MARYTVTLVVGMGRGSDNGASHRYNKILHVLVPGTQFYYLLCLTIGPLVHLSVTLYKLILLNCSCLDA